MQTPSTLSLTGGSSLPSVGLGMWKIEKSEISRLIQKAIRCGYRHFDCACDYGNEAEVGAALAQSIRGAHCRREDLWITSKLWNTYHAPEHVKPALKKSLSDLQLNYLDLYLIHFPIALKYVPFDERYPPEWIYDPNAESPQMEFASVPLHQTWQAMEELVREGLVKNIGVCNFNTGLLQDLLSYATIHPAVLQVELHPYLTQEKLLKFCRQNEISVTAFSPLGANSYFSLGMAESGEAVIHQPAIREIAAKYGKSPAQVVLRWGIQRGTAVIPKTSRVERLEENLALFDFELTEAEMQTIAALNCDRRFNDPGQFCEKAFGRFCPIYD